MAIDLLLNSSTKNTSAESVRRSVLKTISWRIIGTCDTIIISYLITGTIQQALSIGQVVHFKHLKSVECVN
ncbi:DUF2061 domain-containing protein [Flavobacteriaceae bacterium]|nr:DUF2061 domain-containing protein [Flavobacteriaceae bacterium]